MHYTLTSIFTIPLLPLLGLLIVSGLDSTGTAADTTTATVFTPPKAWMGSAENPKSGNPTADGQWRLERIWGDIETPDAWSPMQWSKTQWAPADHSFGGQPAATCLSKTVELGIRGPWAGGGEADGDKTCGVVFIAPAAGVYVTALTVSCDRWQGDGPVYLRTMKRTKDQAWKVSEIDTSPLEPKGETKVDPQKITLAIGDEVGFFAMTATFHTGASVKITPVITRQP